MASKKHRKKLKLIHMIKAWDKFHTQYLNAAGIPKDLIFKKYNPSKGYKIIQSTNHKIIK